MHPVFLPLPCVTTPIDPPVDPLAMDIPTFQIAVKIGSIRELKDTLPVLHRIAKVPLISAAVPPRLDPDPMLLVQPPLALVVRPIQRQILAVAMG